MQIEILGTEYSIERKKISDDILLENKDGYCDSTTKSIVTCMLKPEYGSGLDANSNWGTDEELVDGLLFSFPKC